MALERIGHCCRTERRSGDGRAALRAREGYRATADLCAGLRRRQRRHRVRVRERRSLAGIPFRDRLAAAQKQNNSRLAIGLAPALDTMPEPVIRYDDPFLPFGKL